MCHAIGGVAFAMPSPWRAEIGMMAVARQAEAGEMAGDLGLDVVEALLVEIDAIHLVDDDRDLMDAEQVQQVAVPARLVAHAFGGIDRSAARHRPATAPVIMLRRNSAWPGASISTMSRDGGAEADLAGVERDALVALGLQRIEQERPFERHAAPLADRLELLELAVGQAAGLVQQPADQRRLAVIDMADDDDAHQRAAPATAGACLDASFR